MAMCHSLQIGKVLIHGNLRVFSYILGILSRPACNTYGTTACPHTKVCTICTGHRQVSLACAGRAICGSHSLMQEMNDQRGSTKGESDAHAI